MAQIKNTYRTNQLTIHCEVRKAEIIKNTFKDKNNKDIESQKIEILIDDDDLERVKLVDKDISHLADYERGTYGTFKLSAEIQEEFGTGNFTTRLLVMSFEKDKKAK